MKRQTLRIALAQINCTVGDLDGNCKKIIAYTTKAKELGVDIVSFPELAITGYPPEDLLLKPKFIEDNLKSLKELSKAVNDIVAIMGFVDKQKNNLYNAAAIISHGKIKGTYHKMHLPNYGVFDEKRYFMSGKESPIFKLGRCIFGVNICEDIWHKNSPAKLEASSGAKLIININASPYHAGKIKEREAVIKGQAKENSVFIVYTNLVGGQDELVFDGQSMVVNSKGSILARAEAFQEDLLVVDLLLSDLESKRGHKSKKIIIIKEEILERKRPVLIKRESKELKPIEEIYQALLLGLKDYVAKNDFQKVVIGLSGGIDSSFVATLAKDALGSNNVVGVFMPSRYTSQKSEVDALELAKNLHIKLLNIPIEEIFKVYLNVLEKHFLGKEKDITEENLQARIRGNLLMALSNKFKWLVLTTGNKSEMSTGYATLYGDMAGGFAVIKDVPKTLVYKLVQYRNTLGLVIPERIITKEPTAELRDNQKDKDTLPAYEVLDPILKDYIEEDKDLNKIISLGFDKQMVTKVLSMVDNSEYKRRQSPPGIKITPKAFGRDRRMPITNRYRG